MNTQVQALRAVMLALMLDSPVRLIPLAVFIAAVAAFDKFHGKRKKGKGK